MTASVSVQEFFVCADQCSMINVARGYKCECVRLNVPLCVWLCVLCVKKLNLVMFDILCFKKILKQLIDRPEYF